jgi:ribosomal protein S18 acetylase RimI-like enzyme
VAYYLKSFYEGTILFLDVNKEFRRQHYAEKLLNYAISDLFDRGVSRVRLITRPTNTSARALYERNGFKQYDTDDTFVHYEKLTR